MKCVISIKDKKLRTLFDFACDYLDVYVERKTLILFAESVDSFAMATLPTTTVQDFEKPEIFRVPKKGFFNILQEGVVSFLCDTDYIYVNVENKSVSHMMKFERQICSTAKLDEKLNLIKQTTQYPVIDISDLIMPAKILRNSFSPLTIENKIAFSSIGSLQLYSKTHCSDCALFPYVISHLARVCDGDFENIHNVRNCIVYTDGTHHLLVNKVIPQMDNDINFVMRQKTHYRVTVDFNQAIQLISRVRDYSEVDLNLRKQSLVLRTKDSEYSTRIYLEHKEDKIETLEDILTATHVEAPLIKFPAEVFKNIIYVAKSKKLEIACCKNIVRVSVLPGLMFVCRKESADEYHGNASAG